MLAYLPLGLFNVENVSIEYPGVIHIQFGTMTQLHDLVATAHAAGISVLLEVNWALFDNASILYDIDCNQDWGSYFQPSASDQIGSRRRLDFSSLKQLETHIRAILGRWRSEAGVDGIVWSYTGCMLYGGQECARGFGALDPEGYQLLDRLTRESELFHVGPRPTPYA